ncbi:unnamed protein product (macronuclear) [Paramecium tetraurelia]|uniref:Uncharacterized protein n=1 Tax=Paramecium tetraurelia TaxID=5888 RepID=A0C182_PARTE|nr:uncharacterized protein GSPATT00034025001 [Paramecium tetraurelia]CAK64549.1 unnamed protein product [Paramecium tetraurelia]|eukprot:XP_001431947.1 hypothetical protein (macronuclear) [Paramecium tetraurelia strain d4-2]
MGSTCLQIPINRNDITLWDQVSISKQEKYAQLRIQQKFSESSSCPDEHVQMTSHSNDQNENSQDEISLPMVDQSPAKTCKSILKNKNEFQIVRSNSQNKTVSFSFIPPEQLRQMMTSTGRLSEEQRKFLASLYE